MKQLKTVLLTMFAFATIMLMCSLDTYAYEVQKGDCLWKISKQFGVSVQELARMNGMEVDDILYAGSVIKVKEDGVGTVNGGDVPVLCNGHFAYVTRVNISPSDEKILKSMFNAAEYAELYPDVVTILGNSETALFSHFLSFGLWEGRQPSKSFNVSAYYSAYEDLREAAASFDTGNKILFMYRHFDVFGKNEERFILNLESAAQSGVNVYSIIDGCLLQGAYSIPVSGQGETVSESPDNSQNDPTPRQGLVRNLIVTDARQYVSDVAVKAISLYSTLETVTAAGAEKDSYTQNVSDVTTKLNLYRTGRAASDVTDIMTIADAAYGNRSTYATKLSGYSQDIQDKLQEFVDAYEYKNTIVTALGTRFYEDWNDYKTNCNRYSGNFPTAEYSYPGLIKDGIHYYGTQGEADTAYNTAHSAWALNPAGNPEPQTSEYAVATYADQSTARAAFEAYYKVTVDTYFDADVARVLNIFGF